MIFSIGNELLLMGISPSRDTWQEQFNNYIRPNKFYYPSCIFTKDITFEFIMLLKGIHYSYNNLDLGFSYASSSTAGAAIVKKAKQYFKNIKIKSIIKK